MINLNYTWFYDYQWIINSGALINWNIEFQSNSNSCNDIITALTDLKAPTHYPVECDFISLSNTWVVFFMNADTQQLEESIEVNVWQINNWITKESLDFVFFITVWFLSVIILFAMIKNNLVKISPYLFR